MRTRLNVCVQRSVRDEVHDKQAVPYINSPRRQPGPCSNLATVTAPALFHPWREPLSQMPERASHVPLHRLYADAEQLGDFGVAEPAFATQLEDLAAARRQFLHRLRKGDSQVLCFRPGIRARGFGCMERQYYRCTLLYRVVSQVIERAVANGLKEIALWRSVGVERFAPTPQSQKHVLCQLLGDGLFAHQSLRCAHNGGIPPAEHRVERIRIPGAKAHDQIFITGIGGGGVGHGFGEGARRRRAAAIRYGILPYDEADWGALRRSIRDGQAHIGYPRPVVFP